MCEKVNFKLTSAIRRGSIDRVREIIDSDGLSYSEGYVLLVEAIRRRRIQIAKLLLINGCEVNCKKKKERNSNTPLGLAVANGYAEIVKILLHSGADIHVRGLCGSTVIHTAVRQGNRKIIKLLLSYGADVHAVNDNGLNPLHLALTKRCLQIVEDLLNHGANINSVCTSTRKLGYTPLHFSSEQGNEEAVKLFLSKGADVGATTSDNLTPLHIAVKAKHETVVKLLLEHGANVDAQDNSCNTVLHLAVEIGNSTIVEDILKYRPDINNQSNRNSIKIAVCGSRKNDKEIVENLLRYGFIVNPEDVESPELLCNSVTFRLTSAIRDGNLERVTELVDFFGFSNCMSEGYDLLVEAIRHRHREIAKLLLIHGCNINSKNREEYNSNTPLGLAIANGYAEIVEMLLLRDADIHYKDTHGSTVLHTAVEKGSTKIVKMLLNHGADVNVLNNKGLNPLHLASTEQYVQIAEDLLNHGAYINSACTSTRKLGYTPLHFSSEQGINEAVKLFLSKGADVGATTWDNLTPLHIAVKAQRKAVVKLLLEHGAKVDAQDKSGNTVLHLAVEIGNSIIVEEVLKYRPAINNQSNRSSFKNAVCGSREIYAEIVGNLLRYGFIVNPEDVDSSELLCNALAKGYLKIIEDLLKNGADVNMLDNSVSASGDTLLHSAAINKQDEVAKLLLNYGADVNAKNDWGVTPLYYAVQNSDEKLILLLLTNGADVKDSPELLHKAAANGHLELVEHLLKCGVDVNMLDHSQSGCVGTPLHSAVRMRREEVAKLLVNYGANVNAKDKRGKTPVFYAVQNNDVKIIRLLLTNGVDVKDSSELLHKDAANGQLKLVEKLLKCGADVNVLDYSESGNGGTLLHRQVMLHQEGVAKLLLNLGADVNAKDKRGKTPLFYAIQSRNVKLTRLLLTNGADVKDASELLPKAAAYGRLELVEELLKNGADVNMLDNSVSASGDTLLHSAAINKHDEVAKLLLNYGANVNAKNKTGRTPLFYAVQNSNVKLTRLLLTNGADVKDSSELLHMATASGRLEIVEDLLKYGTDVNMLDHSKYGSSGTPLHIQIISRREEVAKLNYGVNVNAVDKTGRSPVFYAVENNDVIVTRLVLTNGADVKDSSELLHTAAANGRLKLVEHLLKCGADVNMLDHSQSECVGTPLHSAVRMRREEVAKLLVNYGANVNAKDKRGKTALIYAVENSDAKITRLLLSNGADVKDNSELPYIAAANGCLEIVEDLLKCGADVNMLDHSESGCGGTPLHSAVRMRREEVAKLLVNYGANVNAKDKRGKTPLIYAVENSDAKIIRLLLSNGADVKDNSELPYIAAANGCLEIVEDLLKCGADVNMLDHSESGCGGTPLHSAVRMRREEVAKLLVNYGANVNAKDKRGKTPLIYAVENSDAKIIRLLLSNGADVKDNSELPYIAAANGCLEIVEDLLKCGADVNMLDHSESGCGGTLLHSAAIKKHDKVAKLLITYGANVNAKDKRGKTPLIYAVENSDAKITRLLLSNGADIKDTPWLLHMAAAIGQLQIVEDLLKCGIDVNMLDHSKHGSGGTLLHSAAIKKQDEVAKLCITYGANVNAKNKRGKTPLFYAVQSRNAKLTRLLLTNGADVKDTSDLMHKAAANGRLEHVEELLKCGLDVNMLDHSKYGSGGTPLHSAAIKKQDEVAKLLVNYGANVNAKDKWGKTPVSYAVENRGAKITRLLLTNGADIKDTPWLLHMAAASGELQIVEDLLKCGIDVNMLVLDRSEFRSVCTPLHSAVRKKREEVAKLLVNYGANVNAEDKKGKTPVFYAVQNSDVKITRLLLTNGAHVKDNSELLYIAAANGHLEIVQDILKYGTDVNMLDHSKNGSGGTPLHIQVTSRREEVAKLLLNYGVNVNAKNKTLRSPTFSAVENNDVKVTRLLVTNGANVKDRSELLHTAAANGRLELVEDLLKCGADVNMLDNSESGCGGTLLHSAAIKKQDKVAKLFITYGANVNAKDKKGKTPLIYAVENSDAKITRLLLSNGADIKDTPWLLHMAAASGQLQIVEDLLKCGIDVNMLVLDRSEFRSVCTPLHSAVRKDREEVVKLLVNYGANVNAKDKKGKTPVFYAVQNIYVKITRLLLTNGADVKDSSELLHMATVSGHLEIMEDLLKYGIDVNMLDHSKCGSGGTPLHSAAIKKQDEVAKLLVNYGANVNAKDKWGKTPVFYAVENRGAKITRLLLTNGADIKDTPWLLHMAAASGQLQIVEDLLKCGIDVNMLVLDHSEFRSVCTPLHSAVRKKREEVAKLLVNYGANVNAKDKWGKTPVFYAVENRDVKITRLLLTNRADVKDDPELLHMATANTHLEIMEVLLKCGADVNTLDSQGYGFRGTPLHSAVRKGKYELAELLVNYGANVNIKDKSGRTPLFYAVENYNVETTKLLLTNGAVIKDDPQLLHSAVNKSLEIVKDLLKWGANVNSLDSSKYGRGGTPLHRAVREHHDDVVKVLVNYGANVNAKDKRGKTPLFYAVANSDGEIARLLLTNGADIKGDPELLHIAIGKKCTVVVQYLLEHGANVNVIIDYDTPLEFAIDERNDMSDADDDDDNDSDYHDDMDRAYKTPASVEIVLLLKKHIAKLHVAGLYVNDINLWLINDDNKIVNFQRKCGEEIEIMKCYKISNSYVSFYDILTENKNQLAIYANNENIVQAIKSAVYKTMFPIYASMIEGKFRKGLERKELMELGSQFFHSLERLPKLPLHCIEKIISYLSICDVKLLIHT